MRLFRESMAKIPYAPPTDLTTVEWFVECVRKMVRVRRMLFDGLGFCDDADKVGSTIIENLRRGTWLLTEGITETRPRWNGISGNHAGRLGNVVVRGYLPAWSDQLFREVNQTLKEGQLTLAERKRAT